MKLIICEKPSVAKSVSSALGAKSRADGFYEGNGLLVSWCVGHLVSPMDAAGYDPGYKKWSYDDLPILPEPFRYVLAPGKEDAFENLRALMGRPDVDTVVNACDAGREGELIFRLVYEMAGCTKPILRLWISSMEDAAIREGFQNLRPGADYDALYQSALCRQKADWLVGINATRLFSVLYHRTLNVGRVQTPTLTMLADRDWKITSFKKEKYHHVRLTVGGAEAVSEKISSPEDAQAVQAACAGNTAVCTSATRDQKKEQPQPPEKFKGAVFPKKSRNRPQDLYAVPVGIQLRHASGWPVPVGDRNLHQIKIFVQSMNTHLCLYLKTLGENGKAFYEQRTECPIARHDIMDIALK